MADLFFEILNMSISAGWVVLAVLLARLVLKKAPGWMRVTLWSAVGLRLLVPELPLSGLSLLPSSQTVSPEIMTSPNPVINSGVPVINTVVNNVLQENFVPVPEASANPMQILGAVAAVLWIVGMVAMLGYMAVSYLQLRRQVGDAVPHSEGVFLSERVKTPFLLGMWKPKIYLPYFMEEEAIPAVLAHERAHISRKDHWWKPLGFALLSIHWFNPLVWVAYILLCRDIEIACDERAIRNLDGPGRADYAEALLNCSAGGWKIAVSPLTFGEVNVKRRIKAVVMYKKPKKIVVVLSVVVCIILCGCVMTDPMGKPGELQTRDLTESQKERILQAYTTSFDELRWGVEDDSYYGNYDGYDIFLITDKSMSSGNNLTYVGRYVFGHSRNVYFDVYGYRDGEIKPLRLLYNEGEVSEETVKALSEKNNYGKNKVFSYLTETLQEEVEAAWEVYYAAKDFKFCWAGSGDFDEHTNGTFEYYGTVEGFDILYLRYAIGGGYFYNIQIGEYIFKTGAQFELFAYRNGKLSHLSELYEDGKISEQSIAAIHKQFEK